jgi:hypothetical protein
MKLSTFDVENTFLPSSQGYKGKHFVNETGEVVSKDSYSWSIALNAFSYLKDNLGHPITNRDLNELMEKSWLEIQELKRLFVSANNERNGHIKIKYDESSDFSKVIEDLEWLGQIDAILSVFRDNDHMSKQINDEWDPGLICCVCCLFEADEFIEDKLTWHELEPEERNVLIRNQLRWVDYTEFWKTLREKNRLNSFKETVETQRSKGGKNRSTIPAGVETAFNNALDKIVRIDNKKQLSTAHVASLIREYVLDRSEYNIQWKQSPFKQEWFVKKLKSHPNFPAYLVPNKGKTKAGRLEALAKIDSELGLSINEP